MSVHLRGRDGGTATLEVRGEGASCVVDDGQRQVAVQVLEHADGRIVFSLDGTLHRAHARVTPREVRVVLAGREFVFQRVVPGAASGGAHAVEAHEPVLRAPVPGRVLKVAVAAGDPVAAGDLLIVIEAMKMETPIVAPADGTVEEVHVAAGDSVDQDQPVVTCAYGGSPVTRPEGSS